MRNSEIKTAFNKGKILGPKTHLTPDEVRAIEYHLGRLRRTRDLALFRLAIDTMLRASDLVRLKTVAVAPGGQVAERFAIHQKKTGRPVEVVLIDRTRKAVAHWLDEGGPKLWDHMFPGLIAGHLSERQYANLVKNWVQLAGLEPSRYGTHSLRRTKAAAIYETTRDLRTVQLLLGHGSVTTTQRYLGIETDDALATAAVIGI